MQSLSIAGAFLVFSIHPSASSADLVSDPPWSSCPASGHFSALSSSVSATSRQHVLLLAHKGCKEWFGQRSIAWCLGCFPCCCEKMRWQKSLKRQSTHCDLYFQRDIAHRDTKYTPPRQGRPGCSNMRLAHEHCIGVQPGWAYLHLGSRESTRDGLYSSKAHLQWPTESLPKHPKCHHLGTKCLNTWARRGI